MNDDLPPSPAGDDDAGSEPPERAAARLVLDISFEDGAWAQQQAAACAVRLAGEAVAAAPELAFAPAEATVVLTSDAEVRSLNRQWRGKDQPTNVLSFPSPPGPAHAGPGFLGDIVLAAETVHREAREMGLDPAHHITHLVVHGLLHLLGYDHETDVEAELMERLETTILARLGIADPHAAPLVTAALP